MNKQTNKYQLLISKKTKLNKYIFPCLNHVTNHSKKQTNKTATGKFLYNPNFDEDGAITVKHK